jgi:hypothetical protein
LQQLYQDGMAIVRKLGKADLFVTFTCNPKWPEIKDQAVFFPPKEILNVVLRWVGKWEPKSGMMEHLLDYVAL